MQYCLFIGTTQGERHFMNVLTIGLSLHVGSEMNLPVISLLRFYCLESNSNSDLYQIVQGAVMWINIQRDYLRPPN